ncbi:helix-turn-helix transcriptional regulator [Sphaerotilus microaerophilus]|uniref:helix-turn-helix transcriptional regulator n=1 Tax=Sphaerotilus microaerophilus TaxID=2914710 RepID=UPI003D177FF7
MSPLLTPSGLAAVLGLATRTIYNRISTGGDLPPHVRLGNLPRFVAEDVEQWLEQKRRQAPAAPVAAERATQRARQL